MWAEVTSIVEEFKKDTWRRLVDTKQEDNFLELIRYVDPRENIAGIALADVEE